MRQGHEDRLHRANELYSLDHRWRLTDKEQTAFPQEGSQMTDALRDEEHEDGAQSPGEKKSRVWRALVVKKARLDRCARKEWQGCQIDREPAECWEHHQFDEDKHSDLARTCHFSP